MGSQPWWRDYAGAPHGNPVGAGIDRNGTQAQHRPMAASIQIPQRILLGPGPSDVPARVLQALGSPTIGHLDPVFLQIMDEVRTNLRQVFGTNNEMTLAVSGTGSAGMETVFVNLIEPGDRVLIGVNGVFGGRMTDVAKRCGGDVQTVETPWGRIIEQDAFIEAIRKH